MTEATPFSRAGQRHWTGLIDEIVEGRWVNPESGQTRDVPYDRIVIEDTLAGREADLVRDLALGANHAVVVDRNTADAMGSRVAKALEKLGPVRVIELNKPKADQKNIAELTDALADVEGIVAVGSGTINDLCKYVAGRTDRRYGVFATASSMNGYTSTTASITIESGLKVSLPAGAPAGLFVGLDVVSAAPAHLSAAGFADSLVRSVAQVDCWLAHRLVGTPYSQVAFDLQADDEGELLARAAGLPEGDIDANGYLQRILTLCGLGVALTGNTNHGSMGEHQISHYLDCFAGPAHPGSLHGQQVGVAVLTMARLQERLLSSSTPPVLGPTRLDTDGMDRRMGAEIAAECRAQIAPKVFDQAAVERLNARLSSIWPQLREEVSAFRIAVPELERLLQAAGAPTTPADIGVGADLYREAVLHCREMRNRYSFLDLAADSGMLEDFVAEEAR